MADAKGNIVIKKIKKGGGHGHHGGQWKVAYADFVTAMMAFFLLLWLLNATEAEELAGLADYFAPTQGIMGKMGIGFRGGKGALSKGIGADISTNRGIIHGGLPAGPIVKVQEDTIPTDQEEVEKVALLISDSAQEEQSTDIANRMMDQIKDDRDLSNYQDMIDLVENPEGLEIQIREKDDRPMFGPGSAEPEVHLKRILDKLAEIVNRMPNYLSVQGHTTSVRFKARDGYTNWELSADRANATRRYLIKAGVPPEQFLKVIGRADTEPMDPQNPESPVNSRIGIVLLKKAAVPQHLQVAPRGVFVDPESEEVKELVSPDDKKAEEEMKRKIGRAKDILNEANTPPPADSTSKEEDIFTGSSVPAIGDILNTAPEQGKKNPVAPGSAPANLQDAVRQLKEGSKDADIQLKPTE